MAILTIIARNIETEKGISGIKVYLFEGGGGYELPSTATYTGTTNSSGIAQFEVSGFFRVGLSNKYYEAAISSHAVLPEWKDVYSSWGAAGVLRDMEYVFPTKVIAKPPIPRNTLAIVLITVTGIVVAGIGVYKTRKGGRK